MARLRRLSWLRLPWLSRLRLPGLRLWRLRRRSLLRILGHLPLLLTPRRISIRSKSGRHQAGSDQVDPAKSCLLCGNSSLWPILRSGNVVAHLSLLVMTMAQGFQIH
jgi:hypothetical protein